MNNGKGITMFLVAFILLLSTSCGILERFGDTIKGFTNQSDKEVGEQLDFVDVKILLPSHDTHHFSAESIQEAGNLLSSKAEKLLNCSVTFEFVDYGDYGAHMEKAAASGIPYDIVILKEGGTNESAQEYRFDEDEFWYAPWVDKELIKDITVDVQKYFPKGIVYTEMIQNAKSFDGKIYAIPKVYKVFRAYGALCTKEIVENYGSNKINTYTDFIDLIDVNIDAGVNLRVSLTLYQLLDIYLQDVSMTRLIADTVYDSNTETINYLEDTEIADVVINQYKEYCDMGIITYNSSRQMNDDIYVTEYMNYKYINGNNQIPYYAKTASDHSLLLIGGESNDIYYWHPLSAAAIFTTSQQTERALMLLALLNSGNDEYTDILKFGVENKHYKKTQNKKIDLLEAGLLFWGENLLNYESDASVFSFEENAQEWKFCVFNDNIKEIITGVPNKNVFQMFRYMPEEMKKLVRERTNLSGTTIMEYFKADDGVEALLAKMQTEQDEELMNWINFYINNSIGTSY